jgi:hypothetical protein
MTLKVWVMNILEILFKLLIYIFAPFVFIWLLFYGVSYFSDAAEERGCIGIVLYVILIGLPILMIIQCAS